MPEPLYDVIIVGAGPVGLLLANLLGHKGLKCLLLEKRCTVFQHSKAIGITPPSLDILKKLTLIDQFLSAGTPISAAIIHGTKQTLGSISFDAIASEFPYILSVPQCATETILENNLKKFETIMVQRNCEVVEVNVTADDRVEVITVQASAQTHLYSARFVCACDGGDSIVRTHMNIRSIGAPYNDAFLMGDFEDDTNFCNEAHLFFTKYGPVESFPLPHKIRRWIVDIEINKDTILEGLLERKVLERTGIDINKSNKLTESTFGTQHFLNTAFHKNRVLFCGDSAHLMSPIGGQGMNTGFADAELAAHILAKTIAHNCNHQELFAGYTKLRKAAAKTALQRAFLSMRIGTAKGLIVSAMRNFIIQKYIAFAKNKIPTTFAMLDIPIGSIEKIEEFKKFTKVDC